MAKFLSLKTGIRTNPQTGEVVTSAYVAVEGVDRPVRVLDTIDELKAHGTPAQVLASLLMGEHPEYGAYAYLPKIKYDALKW